MKESTAAKLNLRGLKKKIKRGFRRCVAGGTAVMAWLCNSKSESLFLQKWQVIFL